MNVQNLTNRAKGRPLGSKNIVTSNLKETIQKLIEDNISRVQKDLEQMKPEVRTKLLFQLLDYALPKQKAVEVTEVEPKGSFNVVELIYKENV